MHHEIEVRVRYKETDGQGRVHHANYLVWFEQARVEMLRTAGHDYKSLEEAGILLVVAEANMRYFLPATFDDLLRIRVETLSAKGARAIHRYQVFRDSQLLCEGRTVIACVNKEGRVTRLPPWLLIEA